MYITDVIKQAKALHPSEYTDLEYIRWCDELSADIRRNYDIEYGSISSSGAKIMLPEGITINDVSKVVADGRELKKTDLREYGFTYDYSEKGSVIKRSSLAPQSFTVIYSCPHKPLRYIDEKINALFEEGIFKAEIDLCIGDTIKITEGEAVYTVHITNFAEEGFVYEGDSVPAGEREVHFYREITDSTLIPAPYDSAYIDFVNAKVSLYQGDESAYRTFMGQFNRKMNDYRCYLTRNMPRTEAKTKNWF